MLEADRFAATVRIDQLTLGLHNVRCDGPSVADSNLLVVHPQVQARPSEVADAYIRGDDLVVTYEPTQPHDVRLQVYWRSIAGDESCLGGCEAILSMQTSQLESDPTIKLETTASGVSDLVSCSGDGDQENLHLIALTEQLALATMVHPTDFVDATSELANGKLNLGYELFTASLEKGVIRRVRARVVALNEPSQAAAAQHFAKFAVSPPPLTV